MTPRRSGDRRSRSGRAGRARRAGRTTLRALPAALGAAVLVPAMFAVADVAHGESVRGEAVPGETAHGETARGESAAGNGAGAHRTAGASSAVDPDTPAGAKPQGVSDPGKLVFSDEFNGSELNRSKWTARDAERTEDGREDGLRWWYKPANVRLRDGTLALDISRLGAGRYAGARVDTQGKFDYTHGTIEYRLHAPPAEGHLAAAWLQATDGMGNRKGTAADGAEMDLAETAYRADRYPVTLHYDGYGADHRQSGTTVNAPGLRGGWYHTIGLRWTPSKLEFRYDGKVVRTVTDPKLISRVKEFPIASHEILQWADGDVRKAPLDHRSTMYVDHVRVWR